MYLCFCFLVFLEMFHFYCCLATLCWLYLRRRRCHSVSSIAICVSIFLANNKNISFQQSFAQHFAASMTFSFAATAWFMLRFVCVNSTLLLWLYVLLKQNFAFHVLQSFVCYCSLGDFTTSNKGIVHFYLLLFICIFSFSSCFFFDNNSVCCHVAWLDCPL